MSSTPSKTSVAKVARAYEQLAGLYGPTVHAEAALFLDALYETAAQHGHERTSADLGWLISTATEATSNKYSRTGSERSMAELQQLKKALTDAVADAGLTLVPAIGTRSGIAVAPLPDGPVWGWDSRTGLAISIFVDGGWDLTVNQPKSRVFSIIAPVTEAGAREVVQIVHEMLAGERPDPFRGRS